MKLALAVVLASTVAAAQPSQVPPAPPWPSGGVPAPYAYQPQQVVLTPEQRELLDDGEISDVQQVGGGLAALFLGFGSGQAIQGRWMDRGWWFTAGDVASISLMFFGASRTVHCIDDRNRDCDHLSDTGLGELLAGLALLGGFRIWQTVDALVVPPDHNRQVRRLRAQLGISPAGIYGQW